MVGSSWASWGKDLYRKAVRDRIPIAASIALTHHCNLDCIHCYLQTSREVPELPAGEWKRILDEMAEAGCLWLVLTGGEPLLRRDLAEIYVHARKLGFLVTLFTNGTLLDRKLLDTFERHPPQSVEISLHGDSISTYGAVTGHGEARGRVTLAVESLVDMGIRVAVKTVAMKQNLGEVESIRAWCRDRGVDFRVDPTVTPCLDGRMQSCSIRITEGETVALHVGDPVRRSAWTDCLRVENRVPRTGLFSCGAGRMSFHVHPDGRMALCIEDIPVYDLARGSVIDGWNGPIARRRATPLPHTHACHGCLDHAFCGLCPPHARMETGDELGYVDRICRLGRRRMDAISLVRTQQKR